MFFMPPSCPCPMQPQRINIKHYTRYTQFVKGISLLFTHNRISPDPQQPDELPHYRITSHRQRSTPNRLKINRESLQNSGQGRPIERLPQLLERPLLQTRHVRP